MREKIKTFLFECDYFYARSHDEIADALQSFISKTQFAERDALRIPPKTDYGLGDDFNLKMENLMSALQAAATTFATALAAALQASNGTVDQAHLTTLDSEVAALQSNDATDEANVADLTAAVTTITSALNPVAAPAPAPAPAPSPDPVPDSPADSAAAAPAAGA